MKYTGANLHHALQFVTSRAGKTTRNAPEGCGPVVSLKRRDGSKSLRRRLFRPIDGVQGTSAPRAPFGVYFITPHAFWNFPPSGGSNAPPPWHDSMPSGGGVHPIVTAPRAAAGHTLPFRIPGVRPSQRVEPGGLKIRRRLDADREGVGFEAGGQGGPCPSRRLIVPDARRRNSYARAPSPVSIAARFRSRDRTGQPGCVPEPGRRHQRAVTRNPMPCSGALSLALSRRVPSSRSSRALEPLSASPSRQPRL